MLRHRHRDSCALELLLADVSIEDVSVVLGHGSVQAGSAARGAARRFRPRTGPGCKGIPAPARPGRPDSFGAHKPMISGDILPIRSSTLTIGRDLSLLTPPLHASANLY